MSYFSSQKVAKIINEHQIVITGGRYDGIHVDDLFEIYDSGTTVFDPDSGKNLGSLEYVKATIRAIQVFDEMTLCTNAENDVAIFKKFTEGLVGTPVSLNVAPDDISGGIDMKIHVGDLVRKIKKKDVDGNKTTTDQESD